jgi:hypothetical protein
MRHLLFVVALAACTESPELATDEAEALVTGQQCVRGDVVLGQCGPVGGLFEPCTQRFYDTCKRLGGSVGPAVPLVINCMDDSDLFHDCDKDFKAACRDQGGTFGCDNPDCTTGHCTL